jgi:hypothetical protein
MPLRKYSAARSDDDTTHSEGFVTPKKRTDANPEAEPPVFTISATTGAAGSNASASISGTHPNWHISITIPRGDKGDAGNVGPQGPQGPSGVCNCDCCDPDCPPAGTVITPQIVREDIYHYTNCSPMTKGYRLVDIVADGNCGQQEYEYFQWNVGDIGICDGYIYSVDGSGNVTSRWDDSGGGGGGGTCPTGYHWDGFNCVPDDPM